MAARVAALALVLAFVAASALPAAALAAEARPPLTTLCVGLPECEPGGAPAPAPDPFAAPLSQATAALSAGDHALALRLLAPLAAAGSAEAQYRLGDLHYKGQGTALDYAAAGKWYAKAAEQLDSEWAPEAQVNLGIMYALGNGVPKDMTLALQWYEIAAACGSDLAQLELAGLAARLSPEEAARARNLAREWLAKRGRQPS